GGKLRLTSQGVDCGSNILDLGVGVLELARLAAALTEIAVVEGQAADAALGPRLCPGPAGLFLDARPGARHDGNGGFARRGPLVGGPVPPAAAVARVEGGWRVPISSSPPQRNVNRVCMR